MKDYSIVELDRIENILKERLFTARKSLTDYEELLRKRFGEKLKLGQFQFDKISQEALKESWDNYRGEDTKWVELDNMYQTYYYAVLAINDHWQRILSEFIKSVIK